LLDQFRIYAASITHLGVSPSRTDTVLELASSLSKSEVICRLLLVPEDPLAQSLISSFDLANTD
jgi:hypothetical protein